MRGNSIRIFDDALLFTFLFTLARVTAVLSFLPLPNIKATPVAARMILSLAVTGALWPVWSQSQLRADITLPTLFAGVAVELSLGLAIGIVVGIVLEVFQAAAQLISLQAGFAYASTIDPTSGADSPVLVTAAQLLASLFFFCSGADGVFLRVLAESILFSPPGAAKVPLGAGAAIQHFASLIFVSGLRLAAPVMILLLMADVLLAVFGRLQPALQLTSLTFPVKLAASMLLLAPMLRFYPRFFTDAFSQGVGLMERLLSGGHAGG